MNFKQTFNRKCFICKENIEISRNSSNDGILCFDNQFYHEECFNNSNYVKKICFQCHKDIIVKNDNDLDKYIFFDNHYYDKDCFIEMCKSKTTKKWKNALANIEILESNTCNKLHELLIDKTERYGNLQELKNNVKDKVNKFFEESDVNTFIKEEYYIEQVGTTVWKKLSRIYNGEIDGMSVGIPPKHLLDMWQKKINFLNKIYDKNKTKGNEMTKEQRVLYDLSVLVNKYDSYLDWLNSQTVFEEEKMEITSVDVLNTIKIETIEKRSDKNDSEDDIDNLLDEIFG